MRHKSLFITVVLVALAVACGPCESEHLQANKELIQRFTAAINAADWDALDALLTEDFKRHSAATAGPPVTSLEEFKALQDVFYTAMPDQHIEIEMLVAEGDFVAALAIYSGTLTGPMGDFPITGKRSESPFLTIFRVSDGRIAELWVEWDNVAMLTQLGLFPPPPPPPEE
jgi:steroid delta-isomerase-like uncharacterized protein